MVTTYTVTPYIGTHRADADRGERIATAEHEDLRSDTGTTYTFTVQASNPNGSGPVSAASNQVTPQTFVAPEAPTQRLG